MADQFNMSDVMISYSRRDKPFVRQLEQALRDDDLEIWVDWEDIPPTADWWQEIQAGIEAAHTFVFILSPASAQSEVCRREVDHAVLHHKRLVPVLHKPLSEDDMAKMHPALATHNWVYCREEDHFRRAYLTLRSALETDLEHKKLHTRLLVRAREWEERSQSGSLLLRGDDLRQAETWLTKAIAGQTPQPTERQIAYIRASAHASRQLTQRLLGGAVTALLLIVTGMLFALTQSQRANTETERALVEAQMRSTQEWLANAGLARAATAQQVAEDSAAAAATAQAQVLLAQTQEQQALQDAGNSQTQAAIAQDSALTAAVLQGQADDLAATAQREQAAAEESLGQAEQQVEQAQTQAQQAQATQRQAEIQAAAASTQVAVTLAEVMRTVTAAVATSDRVSQDAAATLSAVQATVDTARAAGDAVIQTAQPEVATAQTQLDNRQGTQAVIQNNGTFDAEHLHTLEAQATDQLPTLLAQKSATYERILTELPTLYPRATEAAREIDRSICIIEQRC